MLWGGFKLTAQCSHFRALMKLVEILTFCDDRVNGRGSMAAKKYEETTITFRNIGCLKKLDIEHRNKYEFIDCPFRLIKFPAKECYYKINPAAVHKHVIQCLYQMYYCATIYDAYGVEILVHSCTAMIRFRFVNSIRHLFASVFEFHST